MKKIFLILFLVSSSLFAECITNETMNTIMEISDRYEVSRSVTREVIHEESRGDPKARSHVTKEGYQSGGLFQLYMKPENLNWLLSMFWAEEKEFDIDNPIDNSTVAIKYLKWLHNWLGIWYNALIFYNSGKKECDASEETKEYARRIINAP